MHKAVLLNEVIKYLDPHPGDFIIDGTVNGGGHAALIIPNVLPEGTFLGLDLDKKMIAEKKASHPNEKYLHGNYADLPSILKKEKMGLADGLLLDLGFSSEQLAHSKRGFSFSEGSADEPLFMTYDDSQKSVAEILREMTEEELAKIIFELGGERMSRKIAKAIVTQGKKHPILTSGELAETIRSAAPGNYERGRIDPATRTFQALRIYANDELGNLEKVLNSLEDILKPSGRAVIISFHSLEDRIVKQSFQSLAKGEKAQILTKKPVTASREEEVSNPRSRSAKLRAITIK